MVKPSTARTRQYTTPPGRRTVGTIIRFVVDCLKSVVENADDAETSTSYFVADATRFHERVGVDEPEGLDDSSVGATTAACAADPMAGSRLTTSASARMRRAGSAR
ncbi:hypothetical protein ACOCJ5_17640 [Knoellia sp. CPCC 206450]|uniref:hypothetical protein n=1 Tax=Knoellia tibetensis TaxID=3404798 RepID=UPI003B435F0C